MGTRQAAVAGLFYPGETRELQDLVDQMLAAAPAGGSTPKAIIVPHAGYVYSGPVAASVYARLKGARQQIRRVVLLGPAHRLGFYGIAASSADSFSTPLGSVALDKEALKALTGLPYVQVLDQAHEEEHSLEVQIPFLQELLDDFTLVPLVVGEASAKEVGELLARLWGGPETLIVISSDLSHYNDYETANVQDKKTTAAIENLRYEDLHYGDACGRNPISGLLYIARARGMKVETVDLRNSGDTAGSRDQVVGYGAYVIN